MLVFGWGLYLASSWTWCIGMFLPILLLRWWGWPGFLAFAVPNVLGCALFGYVLTPETSRAFSSRFAAWIAVFGGATIAYQAGFLVAAGMPVALLIATPAAAMALALPPRAVAARDRVLMLAGVVAWVASCALFSRIGTDPLADLPARGTLPPASLAWAAPFMATGFLLCPYLDPTFHLALQRSPSRHCFGVFGVGFAIMLLFTAGFHDPTTGGADLGGPMLWGRSIVLWQWGGQAAFTVVAVAAALRSLRDGEGVVLPRVSAAVIALSLVSIAALRSIEGLLPAMADGLLPATGPVPGEPTYLRWLGLYGVVFPAAVLLGLRRIPWPVQAAAIVTAGILAEMGMIGARMPLLGASVAVLLIAALWPAAPIRATAEIAPTESR